MIATVYGRPGDAAALADVIRPPRPLSESEIHRLLDRDVPARLATVDRSGFPHVTPLWFVWAGGAFHLTSFRDRPHVARLRGNPRAGVCVDVEAPEQPDGERPNQQVRAIGTVELSDDIAGEWTRRIRAKYLRVRARALPEVAQIDDLRVLIVLRPTAVVAVASR